ncbi:MAG: ATP-dependent DNA helicase [Nitrospiria bacterium]
MTRLVEEALERGTSLLIEAATGTGKTWAYLIPSILSRKKIIISTGTKTLQDQLFFKDLPFLLKTLGMDCTFSIMKGKSNYLCLHRFKQSLQQTNLADFKDARDLETIRAWSTRTQSGDHAEITRIPENSKVWQEVLVKEGICLGGKCQDFSTCYLTRMKQEAAAADIVVVNHHLYFADLSLKENGYGEVLPHHDAVIFDEAHLLEDVATQYFGTSFSSYRLEDFIRDAEQTLQHFESPQKSKTKGSSALDLCKTIRLCADHFFQYFKRGKDRYRLSRDDFSSEPAASGLKLKENLKRLDTQINTVKLKSDEGEHLSERIEALQSDLQIFINREQKEEEFVYWVEQRRQSIFLRTSPLNVSNILRDRIFHGKFPVIMTSATLSSGGNFDFLKNRLGIEEIKERILETVFDYEKQSLIYLPTHLPGPTHPKFTNAISDEIIQILEESKGRAFLLFTSWKNLETVYQNIVGRCPYPLLKQGERPKQALIESFRKNIDSVLLGTTSFWQGVDVEGEALSCVVIDKLPFASPLDPLTEARIGTLLKQGKEPFISFQVPSAILSLRQGIGRLIRSSQDRGLIAILDHRIQSKNYGRHFLSALPPGPRTDDFKKIIGFFKEESSS